MNSTEFIKSQGETESSRGQVSLLYFERPDRLRGPFVSASRYKIAKKCRALKVFKNAHFKLKVSYTVYSLLIIFLLYFWKFMMSAKMPFIKKWALRCCLYASVTYTWVLLLQRTVVFLSKSDAKCRDLTRCARESRPKSDHAKLSFLMKLGRINIPMGPFKNMKFLAHRPHRAWEIDIGTPKMANFH